MFGMKKTNLNIVEFTLEFNLDAASRWIKQDRKDVPPQERTKWEHGDDIVEYVMYSIPVGNQEVAYFYGGVNKFSYKFWGSDQPSENQTLSLETRRFCKRNAIEDIEWEMLRGAVLSVRLNYNHSVFFSPMLIEAAHLERTRFTSSTGRQRSVIKVPLGEDDRGEPVYVELHETIDRDGVGYSNEIVCLWLQSPTGVVNYGGNR